MAPRLEGTAWEGTEGALQKQAATQRGGTSVLPASRDAAVVMSLARSHIWLPRSPRRTLVGKSGRARVPAGGAADRPQPARPGSSARTRTRPHAPTRARTHPHAPARTRTQNRPTHADSWGETRTRCGRWAPLTQKQGDEAAEFITCSALKVMME